MKKDLEILRSCPLFDQISGEDLEHFLGCLGAREVFFDKKYTIMSEGSPARYVGILLSGGAQILRIDYYGNRSILGSVEPGQVFGEAFACAELPALPVDVIATEPSRVLLIDRDRILRTCSKGCTFHRQMIFNLMKDLATKSIRFHQKLEITGKRTTRDKLMTYLMLEAKRAGRSRFQIPFDRQELADYLEVDRSGLSAEISKLRKEGVLESRKKEFVLL